MAIEKRTKPGGLLLEHEDGWSLGVQPGDDVVLGRATDTAAPIPHATVARRHCRVRYAGASCTIEDLGSAGGTYVNELLVKKPEVLSDGDVVRIGAFRLTVRSVGPS